MNHPMANLPKGQRETVECVGGWGQNKDPWRRHASWVWCSLQTAVNKPAEHAVWQSPSKATAQFHDTEGTAFMSCSKAFLWVSGQQAANKTSTEPCSRNDPSVPTPFYLTQQTWHWSSCLKCSTKPQLVVHVCNLFSEHLSNCAKSSQSSSLSQISYQGTTFPQSTRAPAHDIVCHWLFVKPGQVDQSGWIVAKIDPSSFMFWFISLSWCPICFFPTKPSKETRLARPLRKFQVCT